jgi:hypothetical protein
MTEVASDDPDWDLLSACLPVTTRTGTAVDEA